MVVTGGGSGPSDFWGLTEFTQSAGLVPNYQGVAIPTNGEMGGDVWTPLPTELQGVGG